LLSNPLWSVSTLWKCLLLVKIIHGYHC
jgi:hypothetical protein